jgi:hypothetical protein
MRLRPGFLHVRRQADAHGGRVTRSTTRNTGRRPAGGTLHDHVSAYVRSRMQLRSPRAAAPFPQRPRLSRGASLQQGPGRIRQLRLRRVTPAQFAAAGTNTVVGTVPNFFITRCGKRKFKYWTYRVAADYKITPDNMVYASYSTGVHSGGFGASFTPTTSRRARSRPSMRSGPRDRDRHQEQLLRPQAAGERGGVLQQVHRQSGAGHAVRHDRAQHRRQRRDDRQRRRTPRRRAPR